MCIGIKKRSLNMGSFLVRGILGKCVLVCGFFLVVVTTSMEA